jgi:hypothetical protein
MMNREELDEWMADNNLVEGEDWEKFDGKYRMGYCDIRKKDGTELGPCWPYKDGCFIDITGDGINKIMFDEVSHVVYYEDSIKGEEEDEEL